MESRYIIVKNHKDVVKVVKACLKTGYCCYDFETNAKPIYNNDFTPTILSISFQPGSGISIPLDHFETKEYCDEGYDWKKELKYIGRRLIENSNISLTKVGWNVKFDDQIWLKYGIIPRGRVLDGMLAKYILNEDKPHGLKEMVHRYLSEFGGYQNEGNIDKLPWDKKPLIPLSKYGCMDTDCTLRLMLFFEGKLFEQPKLHSAFRNLMMCNSKVLTQVERTGLYIDREFNTRLLDEYKPRIQTAEDNILNLKKVKKFTLKLKESRISDYIDSLESELNELDDNDGKDKRKISSREHKISNIKAGIFTTKKELSLIEPINLGSPKQLKELIFSDEGFSFKSTKQTESGEPSTDEETLKELRLTVQNPESPKAIFLDNLLELRGLQKMYTTFIKGWGEKIQYDGRLHGRFNIHGTDSNRFSSADPNLQQIPKTSVDSNIKKQLVAPPGKLYLAFDFSQCELRMMAHLSGDETYLTAFANNVDPHLSIAAAKYKVPIDIAENIYTDKTHPDYKVWQVRRKQAKQIAFGLIYGIGSKLLAEKLSDPKSGIIVSKEEAEQEMTIFFGQHPKIKKFKEKQEKYLRKHGYYQQLFGTKRRLPQIYSNYPDEVAYAIRLGLNFPCQGAAANMTNFGAILVYWLMKQGKLPMMEEVATVHDSIYMYTEPKNINTWTVYDIWNILRNPSTKEYFGFQIDDVDMDMDFTIGRSMAEELPFIPGYDYNKMLLPDFSPEEYLTESLKFTKIHTKCYGKLYKSDIEKYKENFLNRKL